MAGHGRVVAEFCDVGYSRTLAPRRTDSDLVDLANTGLGHRQVQRWNLPAGWAIFACHAHPALVRRGFREIPGRAASAHGRVDRDRFAVGVLVAGVARGGQDSLRPLVQH